MQLFPTNAAIGFDIELTDLDDRLGSFRANVITTLYHGEHDSVIRSDGLWIAFSVFDEFVATVHGIAGAGPGDARLVDFSECFALNIAMTDDNYSLRLRCRHRDANYASTDIHASAALDRETVELVSLRLREFPRCW